MVHWSRVFENGIRLAEQEGVNIRVVQLFSIFHDSRRQNEHQDRGHGRRGAELARKFRRHISLDDDEFSLLTTACELHTAAATHENITIQSCFDSDRLDLGRVGIMPDPQYLCTPLAKEEKTIDWAYGRSLHHKLPSQPFGLGEGVE